MMKPKTLFEWIKEEGGEFQEWRILAYGREPVKFFYLIAWYLKSINCWTTDTNKWMAGQPIWPSDGFTLPHRRDMKGMFSFTVFTCWRVLQFLYSYLACL